MIQNKVSDGGNEHIVDAFDEAMLEPRRGQALLEAARDYPDVVYNAAFSGDPWNYVFGAFSHDPYFPEWHAEIPLFRHRCDLDEEAASERELARAA